MTTPAAPEINDATIKYIEVYVPGEHSGEHLELHVTTGLAPVDYLNKMIAGAVRGFRFFHRQERQLFHLSNYGTAQARLKELDVK